MNTPRVIYVRSDDDPGYAIGIALDELVSHALENGCSEEELRERLEEAIERTAPE